MVLRGLTRGVRGRFLSLCSSLDWWSRHLSLPDEGWRCTQVGRPGIKEPGAHECAPRTAAMTRNSRHKKRWAKVNGVGVGIQGSGLWGSWRGYRFSIDAGEVTTFSRLQHHKYPEISDQALTSGDVPARSPRTIAPAPALPPRRRTQHGSVPGPQGSRLPAAESGRRAADPRAR